MKDAALEQMRQILPELFETNIKAAKPGGMCTPESGCPPATDGADTDIMGMLFKSGRALPQANSDTHEKEVRSEASQAAGLKKADDRPA
jgi:hypothetical protein